MAAHAAIAEIAQVPRQWGLPTYGNEIKAAYVANKLQGGAADLRAINTFSEPHACSIPPPFDLAKCEERKSHTDPAPLSSSLVQGFKRSHINL
ncbi:hypothetical protein R1flu_007809 [Riccia fluitans]|uniref:Uncharacterized protein n=1 Tax=Riccia fluitans TaxID=41844 RepID=A0ABD1Z065_9MARC